MSMCVFIFYFYPSDVGVMLILVAEESRHQRSDRGKYLQFVLQKSFDFLIFFFSVDHRRRDGGTRKVHGLQLAYGQTLIP